MVSAQHPELSMGRHKEMAFSSDRALRRFDDLRARARFRQAQRAGASLPCPQAWHPEPFDASTSSGLRAGSVEGHPMG
jgi:hypothetical protein